MARVVAGGAVFDVDLVVFDKDGTLVDLDVSWAGPARCWLDEASGGAPDLWEEMARRLGFDGGGGRLVPDGVMAAGTLDELDRHTRMILVEIGLDEGAADVRLGRARAAAVAAAMDVDGMPLLGDVPAGFRRLADAGIALGVVTSDDRSVAQAVLRSAGVEHLVAEVVGGDDEVSAKPSPEGILRVCAAVGVVASRALMVGDSTADLLAARSAGVAGFVAVGSGSPAASGADAVVASIDDIVAR